MAKLTHARRTLPAPGHPLMLLLLLACRAAAPPEPPPDLDVVSRRALALVPTFHESLVFAPGFERVAYADAGYGRYFVVLDGEPLTRWDGILPGTPVFLPDGERVAYGAKAGDRWQVVIEGKAGEPTRGEPHPALLEEGLVVSAEGRIAVAAKGPQGWSVLVNGEVGPAHAGIESPRFAGEQVVYVARDSDRERAVVAGVAREPHEEVGLLGATEGRVAYAALRDGAWSLHVDAVPSGESIVSAGWDEIGSFAFGARGFAFAGRRGETWVLVVDGVEVSTWLEIGAIAGAERWAAAVRDARGWHLLLEGRVVWPPAEPATTSHQTGTHAESELGAEAIESLVWSPSGDRLAWAALRGSWRAHVLTPAGEILESDPYESLATELGGGVIFVDEQTVRLTPIRTGSLLAIEARMR